MNIFGEITTLLNERKNLNEKINYLKRDMREIENNLIEFIPEEVQRAIALGLVKPAFPIDRGQINYWKKQYQV